MIAQRSLVFLSCITRPHYNQSTASVGAKGSAFVAVTAERLAEESAFDALMLPPKLLPIAPDPLVDVVTAGAAADVVAGAAASKSCISGASVEVNIVLPDVWACGPSVSLSVSGVSVLVGDGCSARDAARAG